MPIKKLLRKWRKPAPAEQSDAFGFIDELQLVDGHLRLKGWALASGGIRHLELQLGKHRLPVTYGSQRHDVAAAFSQFSDQPDCGFEEHIAYQPDSDGLIHARLIATNQRGTETCIASHLLPGRARRRIWEDYLQQPATAAQQFHIVLATSGISKGGTLGLAEALQPFTSNTLKIGVRLPLLYMRSTLGAAQDYRFDPDFDLSRQQHGRSLVDDNLSGILQHCSQQKLPLLLTMNGGIWGDSSGDAPEWDLTDHLEQDPHNCQWNQLDQVMPDDCLKGLSGSQESPELGRSLTFNCYAHTNRHYKKRNLQAAASHVRQFAEDNPDLLIGINIDPDLYLNPFFDGQQWYDFNPGSLRQFRHWLAGSGPYAGYCPEADCDLSHYPTPGLSLEQACRISGQHCNDWEQLQPPRQAPWQDTAQAPDNWLQLWESFRRHLVQFHYDEMTDWLIDAGIPGNRIFSSQGLMAPAEFAQPFAVHINSPLKNYDSGGMSIAGAKPRHGHLGAIIYGASAVNRIRMEGNCSLFATLRQLDPDWAVVEHNTADLREPDALPGFASASQSLQALFNYAARFVSPMAWNGSNGIFAGQPGFTAYTAFRNTPLEQAVKHFMHDHANLPRGARAWLFGHAAETGSLGWSSTDASIATGTAGNLRLHGQQHSLTLQSPDELQLPANSRWRLLLISPDNQQIDSLQISCIANHTTEHNQQQLSSSQLQHQPDHSTLLLTIGSQPVEQLQLTLQLKRKAKNRLTLQGLILLPD